MTLDHGLADPMGNQGSKGMGPKRCGRRDLEGRRVVLEEQAKSQWGWVQWVLTSRQQAGSNNPGVAQD